MWMNILNAAIQGAAPNSIPAQALRGNRDSMARTESIFNPNSWQERQEVIRITQRINAKMQGTQETLGIKQLFSGRPGCDKFEEARIELAEKMDTST